MGGQVWLLANKIKGKIGNRYYILPKMNLIFKKKNNKIIYAS